MSTVYANSLVSFVSFVSFFSDGHVGRFRGGDFDFADGDACYRGSFAIGNRFCIDNPICIDNRFGDRRHWFDSLQHFVA